MVERSELKLLERTHFLVRILVAAGIIALIWLEFQRGLWPGQPPFSGWKPFGHKWVGITIDTFSLLIVLTALLFCPIFVFDSFRVSRITGDRSRSWIDLLALLLLYCFFFALLAFGALGRQIR